MTGNSRENSREGSGKSDAAGKYNEICKEETGMKFFIDTAKVEEYEESK